MRMFMKKYTITYAALVLILFIALFLGLRVWATDRAVSVVGPSAIHLGADGTIYIMSNDILYVHDKDGDLLDKIPMTKFGIDHVVGEFWVYKNGDLLLRRAVPQTLTASGWAEMFARTGAGEKDRLDNGESILEQCSARTYLCRNLGAGKDVFDKLTAFSAFVDEEQGITYLSDTVGHQLLMLDDNGMVIKKSTTPFQFPNQIVLDSDGLLYVADTNNHRVAAVKATKENYGAVEKEFKIIHPRNPFKPTWPMALAHVADKKWWVINADDNMRNGIVMILNEKGAFEKVVSLPHGADPLRLVTSDDRVLITDPTLMRVYAANQSGRVLDDFGSLSFKQELSELRRERRAYEAIATASMWALLILLAGALLLARQVRVQTTIESSKSMEPAEPRAVFGNMPGRGNETKRYDFHSLLGLHRIKFAVLTVLLVVVFVFFVLISRGLTLFHKEFFPAALLGHCAVSFFTYLQFKKSYVEISERGITYQGMTRNVHSPWNGVKKISVYGSASKIVTDYGNFSIGLMEPADNPPAGWTRLFGRQRLKFHKDLIEEIRRHAPQAKVSISWLVRYQWNRLPSACTEKATGKSASTVPDKNEAGD